MKSIHWKILLAIGLIILVMCILISEKIKMEEVTGWILFGTMVVVIFYTIETYEMRRVMIKQNKEMIKQTELRMRPLITLYFEEGREQCFIKNVGYGAAMNVKIDDLYLPKDAEEFHVHFVFDTIYAIMPNEVKMIINYKAYASDGSEFSKSTVLTQFWLHFKKQTHELNVKYKNLIGDEYSSKVQCGEIGNILLETKKINDYMKL